MVVVVAIIYYEGKILCCQRKKSDQFPGKWEFPGGKVKKNETLHNALARELSEELGISNILKIKLFHEFEHKYMLEKYKIYAYTVELSSYVVSLNVHEMCKWTLPSEINQLDWLEGNIELVNKLSRFYFSNG